MEVFTRQTAGLVEKPNALAVRKPSQACRGPALSESSPTEARGFISPCGIERHVVLSVPCAREPRVFCGGVRLTWRVE